MSKSAGPPSSSHPDCDLIFRPSGLWASASGKGLMPATIYSENMDSSRKHWAYRLWRSAFLPGRFRVFPFACAASPFYIPVFGSDFWQFLGRSLSTLFILLLALGAERPVGYPLLQLGIAAFSASACLHPPAFCVFRLSISMHLRLFCALCCAAPGFAIDFGAPTASTGADYLALVTLGFGKW